VSRACPHCGELYEEEGRLVCPHCGVDVELTHAEDPEEADFAGEEEGEGPPGRGSGCAILLLAGIALWALL
jgi:uncharacterized Zn finger protein (UPF0148 family)